MSKFVFFFVLAFLCAVAVSRPQYKEEDFDYRMFEDDNAGVVIDRVIEPRHKHSSHHHHHHSHRRGEKTHLKTNRVHHLKGFFDSFRL